MAPETPSKPHVLLVGMPFQGHFTPSVNLAIKLAAHGLTVTFFHAHVVHHQNDKKLGGGCDGQRDVFADARSAGLDIRYVVRYTGIPVCLADRPSTAKITEFIFDKLAGHVEQLILKLNSGSRPVDCLIADTFYCWSSTVAKKIGIPYVSLWTEPATVLAVYYHMDLLRANGHCASKENRKDRITYVPGIKPLDPRDLASQLRETEFSKETEVFLKAFEGAKAAEFVIANVVQELEEETVAVLLQKQKFYPIGPIFSGDFKTMVKTSLFPESECLQWLDTKLPGSVLYVSFGSISPATSQKEIEEIAYGVLGSHASFIWVSRPEVVVSVESSGRLPEGFEEESRGRGLIVPWCNQREVLMHPSVGGFLTHCGWNSILESVWCGIPMICYPLLADQYTNRKLVVEDWKIGFDFGREEVLRGQVSKTIDALMEGEAGLEVKKEVKKLQKVVRSAIAADGSSRKNFENFISDLSNYIAQKGAREAYKM